MKKYKKITEDERNEIVVMLSKNKSIREIAKKLLRSAGSISREIKKNDDRKPIKRKKEQRRAKKKVIGSLY
jgi:IS30 family transposase